MPLSRKISRVVTVPPIGPGFAGPAHTAAAVIPPGDFEATDPFFLMMDDRISVAGQFGGEHPHAGLETVTFILSGTMEDLGGKLLEGDVEWMTAGRGIIHAEKAVVSEGMRLLQLWVVLPENQRHIAPRVQLLARDRMPVRQEPGVEARLYSGRSGGLEAATTNQVPMTLLDIRLQSGASFGQELPSSYNGFLFVLEGALTRWRSIGGDRRGSRKSATASSTSAPAWPPLESCSTQVRLRTSPSHRAAPSLRGRRPSYPNILPSFIAEGSLGRAPCGYGPDARRSMDAALGPTIRRLRWRVRACFL